MPYFDEPDYIPYPGCTGTWIPAQQFTGGKSFGHFCCNYCEKQWMSAHAKKGYKQGCKYCDEYFYPLYLWKNDSKNVRK